MNYDFDTVLDRRSVNSVKWDVGPNELPMWVADMDFNTAPEVVAAIQNRLDAGAFGYGYVTDDFKTSITTWWERRHNWQINPDWILFCTGVVPAISSIVRKMTTVGDNVVVLAPVYNIFFNSIINNARQPLVSELAYADGAYHVDYTDLEVKLALPETTMLIFCNPHNPIGKVWEPAELERIGNLCVKHNVLLLSDEIHCDLTHKGFTYTPMASVSEAIANNTITCVSASKAFNLAGLQSAAIIIKNEKTRQLVDRGINTDEVAEPNAFTIQAVTAAFTAGEAWLNELIDYLDANQKLLEESIRNTFPEITIVPGEATYLAWFDCSKITDDTTTLCQFIREQTGLYLSAGEVYRGNGNHFIRWNYACPRSVLKDGINRFIEGVRTFLK